MEKLAATIMLCIMLFTSCRTEPRQREKVTLDLSIMEDLPRLRRQVVIRKELLYDKYTLADTFPYRDTVRMFQWDKIRGCLEWLDSLVGRPAVWGVVQNRNNVNGEAPLARKFIMNAYDRVQDAYGIERRQSAPLYASLDSLTPERYALDGSLVRILSPLGDSMLHIEPAHMSGIWATRSKYVKPIPYDSANFARAVFVDRTNQVVATLERSSGSTWLVRSMNPATTGLHHPPYQKETPLGVFVVQEKKKKMHFLIDGTREIAGFAPFASRFCCGGYVHGIPVNKPRTELIEYSWTLGTTPRSHMCVRNATSHAEFVFDWAKVDRSLVFVIE